ncbi:hypothetical protein ACFTAO_10545 [Paenibacillus rhizoplanae]
MYHVGGINYFSDPHAAVLEMIRVAKPGTRLMIADETQKLVKGTYGKVPVVKGYFCRGRGPAGDAWADSAGDAGVSVQGSVQGPDVLHYFFRKP